MREEVPSRWRPGAGRLGRLLLGLVLFGIGEGLLVASALGNSPWTVLAQGVAVHTGIAVGTATIAISFVVLLAWVPLRQRPGLGTILNAIVIGLAIDATLALVPGHGWDAAERVGAMALAIAVVALGSGLYLTAMLGPGPRDGLMTGLHRASGVRIGAVRTALEVSVVVAGALLGGRAGVGTLAFALAIGPLVALMLGAFAIRPLHEL